MRFIWTAVCVLVAVGVAKSCEKEPNSPRVGKSLVDSDLVIAGYTRAVIQTGNESKAEFLVFNTYKGENLLPQLLREKEPSALESALSRRLVNVSGFGCQANVRVGETYVLFLTVTDRVAHYGGGQLIVYSREKEEAIQEALGSLGSWSEWSPCTKTCGAGRQVRRRNCGGQGNGRKCSPEDGQERTCNIFPCAGLFDVIKVVGLPENGIKSANRTSAFEIPKNNSWQSRSILSLHRAFPLEFGLLMTINPLTPGYVFRIVLSNKIQFGVLLGESNITLIISDAVQAKFNSSSSWGNTWHTLSFLFRRNTITFFQNCKPAKLITIDVKLRPLPLQSSSIIVGGFQGDIEQLVIAEAPSAAAEQCNPNVQPLMHLDSPSREDMGVSELRTRANKENVFRGDLFSKDEEEGDEEEEDDDEDFAFGENGSGLRDSSKVIPLISDDDEHYADGPDEEDDASVVTENWNELLDDEVRQNDQVDNLEGSGSQSQELLWWSDWSPCSHSCGWGTRSRTPYCADNAVDMDACSQAINNQRQTETCFIGLCPTSTSPSPTPSTTTKTTTATLPSVSPVIKLKAYCALKCENGGVCNPYRNNCRCFPGYYGKHCEYAICKPGCQNRGVCVAPNKCHCKNGYIGKACQRAICHEACQNGGQCIVPGRCACSSGYSGQHCETPQCNPPCYNGGYCVKPYSCHCPPSSTGAFCEKFMCYPACHNGGVCNHMGKCDCPRGFKGRYCEKAHCNGGCENGGICGKNGKCICSTGFHGIRCEKRKCVFTAVNEPYKRGYKQKIITEVKVPCGAWGWKQCIKMKTHYVTVFKTFYRTAYHCVPVIKSQPGYSPKKMYRKQG